MFTPSFTASLVAIGALAWMASTEWDKLHNARAKTLHRVALGMAALVAALISFSATSMRTPLVSADLQPGSSPIEVQAGALPPSLLISGQLPPVSAGHDAGGNYKIEVKSGTELVLKHEGEFSEHWKAGRAGRRGQTQNLIQHSEERVDLPRDAANKALTVQLDQESGDLHSPVHIDVIPAPAPLAVAIGAGVLVALVGCGADVVSRMKGHAGVYASVMAGFGIALLNGITPHSPVMSIMGAGVLGVLIGAPSGFLLRSVAARFTPAESPSPTTTTGAAAT